MNKVVRKRERAGVRTWRPHRPGACVECGVWRVECGVWRVACGVWRVACGVWRAAGCHGYLQPSPRNDPRVPQKVGNGRLLLNYKIFGRGTPSRHIPAIASQSRPPTDASIQSCKPNERVPNVSTPPGPSGGQICIDIGRGPRIRHFHRLKNAISPYQIAPAMEFRLERAPPGTRNPEPTRSPAPELTLRAGGARWSREWPMETTRWRGQPAITCPIHTLRQAYVAIYGHGR
jgi:hypothetical protein